MAGDRNSGGGQPRKLTEAEKSRLLVTAWGITPASTSICTVHSTPLNRGDSGLQGCALIGVTPRLCWVSTGHNRGFNRAEYPPTVHGN